MKKNSEYGRSMVEMVGVLAVMGLITAGAFVLINTSLKAQKISRADDDVANIAANIRLLGGETADYSGLPAPEGNKSEGTQLLKNLSLVSNTPFGSSTTYSVTRNSADSHGFVVLLMGLSAQDCLALSRRTWNGAVNQSCNTGNSLSVVFAG